MSSDTSFVRKLGVSQIDAGAKLGEGVTGDRLDRDVSRAIVGGPEHRLDATVSGKAQDTDRRAIDLLGDVDQTNLDARDAAVHVDRRDRDALQSASRVHAARDF